MQYQDRTIEELARPQLALEPEPVKICGIPRGIVQDGSRLIGFLEKDGTVIPISLKTTDPWAIGLVRLSTETQTTMEVKGLYQSSPGMVPYHLLSVHALNSGQYFAYCEGSPQQSLVESWGASQQNLVSSARTSSKRASLLEVSSTDSEASGS